MASFFPRQTVAWKLEEPAAFRRLSLSIVEMAVLAGVVLRLVRSLALTHAPTGSWLWLGGTIALGAVLLFGLTTAHLGNYPVRHWLWRAPLFGAIEASAEMITSLPLIALGREPIGSARMTFAEWPTVAIETILLRTLAICLFSLLLAGVVQVIRRVLLRHDHRTHTAVAIHDEIARTTADHHGPR